VVPESSIIVEHLDRHGDAPPLIPTDPDEALHATVRSRGRRLPLLAGAEDRRRRIDRSMDDPG
jgi:glutathione S-transferase